MTQYLVEFMNEETVVSSRDVKASTPFMAASIAARGSMVDFHVDKADWIRVTPPGKPPFEFGHTRILDEGPRKPVRKSQHKLPG